MAGVAKWLRRWFVVPVLAGSNPVICPIIKIEPRKAHQCGLSGFWFLEISKMITFLITLDSIWRFFDQTYLPLVFGFHL